MTELEVIQKAIQGGWKGKPPKSLINPECLIDPDWWQALGKAMRWGREEIGCVVCDHRINCAKHNSSKDWLYHWHRLIDHLAEGGSIESFFEKL